MTLYALLMKTYRESLGMDVCERSRTTHQSMKIKVQSLDTALSVFDDHDMKPSNGIFHRRVSKIGHAIAF